MELNYENDKTVYIDHKMLNQDITLYKKENIEIEFESDREDNSIFDKNEYLENIKVESVVLNKKQIYLEQEQEEEPVIIKKKKGRKSKKEKMLLENQIEKDKKIEEKKNLFPKLGEVIFDVIIIDKQEYFHDKNLNILYDFSSNPIGIFDYTNNNFILYETSNQIIKKIYNDNFEFEKIFKNFKIFKF
jgi:hypothetical protein